MRKRWPAAFPVPALLLAGCGMGSPALPYMRGDTMMAALNETGAGKITHIVYIVQENRSFDNLFQAIRARIPSRAGKTQRADDRAAAGPPRRALRHRPLRRGDVFRVQRLRRATARERTAR